MVTAWSRPQINSIRESKNLNTDRITMMEVGMKSNVVRFPMREKVRGYVQNRTSVEARKLERAFASVADLTASTYKSALSQFDEWRHSRGRGISDDALADYGLHLFRTAGAAGAARHPLPSWRISTPFAGGSVSWIGSTLKGKRRSECFEWCGARDRNADADRHPVSGITIWKPSSRRLWKVVALPV